MKLDKEHWKELDINVNSLWLMGSRGKEGKHSNVYHGNFVPQIPNQMIRRYTEEGDVVLDMFMGSGTTLFECESLKRNFIGFDINQEIIDFVKEKMFDTISEISYSIHNCDITNTPKVQTCIEEDLNKLGKKNIDLLIMHPPYMDIVKFTEQPEDLSNVTDLNLFIEKFIQGIESCYKYLSVGKYMILVIGDLYKNGEVLPLGFYLMYAIKKKFPCLLKGIVVKDMVGNRGKIGMENLWIYRALKNGNYIFKHEYLFVFKKSSK